MDPRSASTGPVDDPRGALVHLAERADVQFENFQAARQRTRDELERRAHALRDAQLASGLSIVVFGSWAREELAPGSDDDWALLAVEPFEPDDPVIRAGMEAAAAVLGIEGKAPGAQAVFGVPFDGRALIENIGLEADFSRCCSKPRCDRSPRSTPSSECRAAIPTAAAHGPSFGPTRTQTRPLDDHLAALAEAVDARRRLLHTVRSATALATLCVGDRVCINDAVRPRHLAGMRRTVVNMDDDTATVRLPWRLAASRPARSVARRSHLKGSSTQPA